MESGVRLGPQDPSLVLLMMMMMFASAVSKSADISLKVSLRTNVVLPCEGPAVSDQEDVTLEWTRSDLHQSYVFIFRDGRPLKSFQHPHFKGRVELYDPDLQTGNFAIILRHVGKTDNGRYHCHVLDKSQRRKRSMLGTEPIRTVELTVVDPDSPQSDFPLRVSPRSDVTLPCEGHAASNLTLKWTRSDLRQSYVFLFRNGHPLSDSQHPHFRDRVELSDPDLKTGNYSIKLKHVGKSDNGRYKCHVLDQSQRRKRSVSGTDPIRTMELMVIDSGAASRFTGGVGFMAVVVFCSLFLQIWE